MMPSAEKETLAEARELVNRISSIVLKNAHRRKGGVSTPP